MYPPRTLGHRLVTARPQSAHAHRCKAIVVDALARGHLHTSARTWRGEDDLAGSVRRALPGSESHAGTRHWITCIGDDERHSPAPADAARIGSDAQRARDLRMSDVDGALRRRGDDDRCSPGGAGDGRAPKVVSATRCGPTADGAKTGRCCIGMHGLDLGALALGQPQAAIRLGGHCDRARVLHSSDVHRWQPDHNHHESEPALPTQMRGAALRRSRSIPMLFPQHGVRYSASRGS